MKKKSKKKVEEKFGISKKKYYICSVRKKLSLINKKITVMYHYVNCENAKKAVAKIVTFFPACSEGKNVYFYGDYDTATDHYESTKESKIFQLGFERAELYFRGVGNKWIEMVAED